MKKINYTAIATWFAFTYIMLDVIGIVFIPDKSPPNAAQVERLIAGWEKERKDNQKNIKTFEDLYITKGNRFEKHIRDSEKNMLPLIGGK